MAETYRPLTIHEWQTRMRKVSARLLEVSDEHSIATEEEATATSDYEEAYRMALLLSYVQNEKWPVSRHEAHANDVAKGERRAMHAAVAKRRALAQEAHSLRQILSNLQTNSKLMLAAGA